ncbi:MAG TPA: GNAT family acetyltransferase [Desulfopila sp.]|nr:GNAT family acetyltransferase [Desulfopila sp.]
MPAELCIRPFEDRDADEVVRLWHDCRLITPWNDPFKDIARKKAVDPELFLVGLVEGAPVATVMAGYEGHRGWINYLAVAKTARRCGYGSQMMAAAEKLLRTRGCPKINLVVRRTNGEAAGFYASLGFSQDEVISLGKRLESDECQSG